MCLYVKGTFEAFIIPEFNVVSELTFQRVYVSSIDLKL